MSMKTSISPRRANHLKDAANAIVAAEAALVKWRARNRFPVVAVVTGFRLRQARQRRIVLPVVAAHLVNDRLKRRHDDQRESAGARFPIRIARRASDVSVRVLLEHQ